MSGSGRRPILCARCPTAERGTHQVQGILGAMVRDTPWPCPSPRSYPRPRADCTAIRRLFKDAAPGHIELADAELHDRAREQRQLDVGDLCMSCSSQRIRELPTRCCTPKWRGSLHSKEEPVRNKSDSSVRHAPPRRSPLASSSPSPPPAIYPGLLNASFNMAGDSRGYSSPYRQRPS